MTLEMENLDKQIGILMQESTEKCKRGKWEAQVSKT